ncbi:hypothetical protein B0H13DRAFT_2268230 [Mycena leptocephala]|nr:hypothetical protein B0H13DRAFT_2268230 [Mycena leptocephala]
MLTTILPPFTLYHSVLSQLANAFQDADDLVTHPAFSTSTIFDAWVDLRTLVDQRMVSGNPQITSPAKPAIPWSAAIFASSRSSSAAVAATQFTIVLASANGLTGHVVDIERTVPSFAHSISRAPGSILCKDWKYTRGILEFFEYLKIIGIRHFDREKLNVAVLQTGPFQARRTNNIVNSVAQTFDLADVARAARGALPAFLPATRLTSLGQGSATRLLLLLTIMSSPPAFGRPRVMGSVVRAFWGTAIRATASESLSLREDSNEIWLAEMNVKEREMSIALWRMTISTAAAGGRQRASIVCQEGVKGRQWGRQRGGRGRQGGRQGGVRGRQYNFEMASIQWRDSVNVTRGGNWDISASNSPVYY